LYIFHFMDLKGLNYQKVDELKRLIGNPSIGHNEAMEASSQLEAMGKEVVPYLIDIINKEPNINYFTFSRFCIIFGKTKDARAVNVLLSCLDKYKKDPQQTSALGSIVMALGRIQDKRATIPIINFLDEYIKLDPTEHNLTERVFEAIAKLADERATPFLLRFLLDNDFSERGLAIKGPVIIALGNSADSRAKEPLKKVYNSRKLYDHQNVDVQNALANIEKAEKEGIFPEVHVT
jgi:HEAT repeat protein